MTLIERQAPSHWYLRDGRPFHEIAKKDGTGNRAVTLADARKVLALPSVTNILGVLAKPGLDAWKIEQGILAALTLPRQNEEPLDAFARRVVADMGEQVEKAADFGTAIHAACEAYAVNKERPADAALLPFFKDWQRWFDENVERIDCIESVFVHHEYGYAGRVDSLSAEARAFLAPDSRQPASPQTTPHSRPADRPAPGSSPSVTGLPPAAAELKLETSQPAETVLATGFVSMTFRLPAELPAALVRASADRKVRKQEPFTQQDIVAGAVQQWLRAHGFLL